MDWQELKGRKPLDPKTPAEHTEALRRMVNILINDWDNFEDGDGEASSPDVAIGGLPLLLVVVLMMLPQPKPICSK